MSPARTVVRGLSRQACGLVLLLLAGIATGCRRAEPLPDQGTVPAFDLVDHTGAAFQSSALAGTVWIANFVFTHCPDICPALSQQMARLQRELPERGGQDIRLVSFSVDPTRDTPAVLQAYATQIGAGPHWRFLTGPRPAISSLLREGFHVAWADDGPADMPITHSDRFALVDRRQRIRGTYHGMDAADLARLADDAVRLQAHPDE